MVQSAPTYNPSHLIHIDVEMLKSNKNIDTNPPRYHYEGHRSRKRFVRCGCMTAETYS